MMGFNSNQHCLIIGAQKAGTTSIYVTLRKHPYVNLTKIKESRFFYRNELYQSGPEAYAAMFSSPIHGEQINLDVDPDLLLYDFVPERIYNTLGPDTRFIVVLRDPVQRAYSQYQMQVFRRKEDLSFSDALEAEPERTKSDIGKYDFGYILRSKYYQLLQPYLVYFPLHQFKFFIFETEFLPDKQGFYKTIDQFLQINGVDQLDLSVHQNQSRKVKIGLLDRIHRGKFGINYWTSKILSSKWQRKIDFTLLRWNSNTTQPAVSANLRSKLLQQEFVEDISMLELLIQKDLSHWKN